MTTKRPDAASVGRRARTIAIGVALAAAALLLVAFVPKVRGVGAGTAASATRAPASAGRVEAVTSAAPIRASRPPPHPGPTIPTVEDKDRESAVGRLMTRYRAEDLELLTAVARRTKAAPSPAIYRLLDAAREDADDGALERIIREDVDDVLVRHDCFEWLRRRRGEPPAKLPAFVDGVVQR